MSVAAESEQVAASDCSNCGTAATAIVENAEPLVSGYYNLIFNTCFKLLKDLLQSVDDMERAELSSLRTLADQLKSDAHRFLQVQRFRLRQDASCYKNFFFQLSNLIFHISAYGEGLGNVPFLQCQTRLFLVENMHFSHSVQVKDRRNSFNLSSLFFRKMIYI